MSIQQYNTKVENIHGSKMVGDSLWKIYFGVELEVEVDIQSEFIKKFLAAQPVARREQLVAPGADKNSAVANFACDALYPSVKEFAIIKRDGSLKNGMEIVSVPMSLGAHGTEWDNFFAVAEGFGLVVRGTCGMHVHVSRELLTPLQIGKVLAFLHDPNNLPFIKIIAGRIPPTKYANITTPRKVTDYHKHTNRYDGLNITGGATIEFRIFKGTIDKERMLANIEFCASLVGFTWPGVAGVTQNTLSFYLDFVHKRYKEYPNLHRFLVSKKLLTKPLAGKKKMTKAVAMKLSKAASLAN